LPRTDDGEPLRLSEQTVSRCEASGNYECVTINLAAADTYATKLLFASRVIDRGFTDCDGVDTDGAKSFDVFCDFMMPARDDGLIRDANAMDGSHLRGGAPKPDAGYIGSWEHIHGLHCTGGDDHTCWVNEQQARRRANDDERPFVDPYCGRPLENEDLRTVPGVGSEGLDASQSRSRRNIVR
jgi:hypothetical protein